LQKCNVLMSEKIKIGLFGVGHLGKIHLKCLLELHELFEFVGFYDPNSKNAEETVEKFGVKSFESEVELMESCDAVDIVAPTNFHFSLAMNAIESAKHVFIEKPICSTAQEAYKILAAANKMQVKGQVGFVERFNPAFTSLNGQQVSPKFIEAHRMSVFNPRGTDVSVVLDLMIHDLDILLKLVDAPVYKIYANGVAVLSETEDIANARIEFENGTVANITASRISMKPMRKFRLFQQDAYISMDFLDKKTEIIRLLDSNNAGNENLMELETSRGKKYLEFEVPESEPVNAIKTELKLFAESIIQNKETSVPLYDGVVALELAHDILAEIEKNRKNQHAKH
jgi:predicted dehydrogenase